MTEDLRSSLGAEEWFENSAPDFVPVPVSAVEAVSQLPWGWTCHCPAHPLPQCHYVLLEKAGRARGLICWHFVSRDWNWNLPNHSLVFSVKVTLVHVKPQVDFCLRLF